MIETLTHLTLSELLAMNAKKVVVYIYDTLLCSDPFETIARFKNGYLETDSNIRCPLKDYGVEWFATETE